MYLVKNFEYMMTLLSITATYFLTTGIQFWISDYWNIILGESKENTAYLFAFCAITGPLAGVAAGGTAFSRIGGFESPRSFPLAVYIMTVGSIVAFPLPWVTRIQTSFILLWF